MEGLTPKSHAEAVAVFRHGDKGRALALTPEQRQLLLDIRKEHPSASVPLMLRTLEAACWTAVSGLSGE